MTISIVKILLPNILLSLKTTLIKEIYELYKDNKIFNNFMLIYIIYNIF